MLTLSNNHDCASQMSEHALQYAKKKDWVSAVNGVYQTYSGTVFNYSVESFGDLEFQAAKTPEGCDYRRRESSHMKQSAWFRDSYRPICEHSIPV